MILDQLFFNIILVVEHDGNAIILQVENRKPKLKRLKEDPQALCSREKYIHF